MDFGTWLVEHGTITDEQLRRCRYFHEKQNQVRIGRLAVAKGLMSVDAVKQTTTRQGVTGEPFGEAAIKLGLVKPKDLISLLRIQRPDTELFGEYLVELRILNRTEMAQALDAYLAEQNRKESEKESDRPSGSLVSSEHSEN